jgi:DNA invertase Pin-like site-specific DNA recombinase
VHVFVTQLGATDLTNSAGKMLLAMLAAFAEMERDLIIERTQAGLARARAKGVKLAADPRRRMTTIVTPYARGSRQARA